MRQFTTFLIVFLCLLASTNAQTTWTGNADSDWLNAANWDNGLPSPLNEPANVPLIVTNPAIIDLPAQLDVDYELNIFGSLLVLSDVRFTNDIYIDPTGLLTNQAAIRIINLVQLVNDGDIQNESIFYNFGEILNNGDFLNFGGSADFDNKPDGIFNSPGNFVNDGGSFKNSGDFQLTGNFTNNSSEFYNYALFVVNIGSNFYNGVVQVSRVRNLGDFTVSGFFQNLIFGTVVNRNDFLIVPPGQFLNINVVNNFDEFRIQSLFQNASVFINNAMLTSVAGSTFDNTGGSVSNNSCATYNHLTTNDLAAGTFTNNGIVYDPLPSNVSITTNNGVVLNDLLLNPSPTALCHPNVDLILDGNGEATLLATDLDNGSSADYCGPVTLSIAVTDFECADVGVPNPVTLTVTDATPEQNQATCVSNINVIDNQAPTISCPANISLNLFPFECERVVDFIVDYDDNCSNAVLSQTDGTGLSSGSEFPVGTTTLSFQVDDGFQTATCSFSIEINEFVPQTTTLVCNDLGQLSLSEDCVSDILPQDVLMGFYGCGDDLAVEIMGYGGSVVDETFIGLTITVTVTNVLTGNNCMGDLIVMDKMPPFADSCANDTISCIESLLPDFLGGDVLTPEFTDCSDFDLYYYDFVENYPCDSSFSQKVTREWYVEDEYGNRDTCRQEIFVERVTLANANPVCPAEFITECSDLGNVDLSPIVTGYPVIDVGGNVYELNDTAQFCGMMFGFRDDTLNACGGSIKILRTWTLYDWCLPQGPANPWVCLQTVKAMDTTPPVLDPIAPYKVAANTGDCYAIFNLPVVSVQDCSPYDVTIFTPAGVVVGNGGQIPFPGLPTGTHTVTYRVQDDCGNLASLDVEITVEDQLPPVPVCETFRRVGLTSNGTARLYAQSLDDGSNDECCLDRFEVKRLNDACGYPDDLDFGEYVNFCCDDMGQDLMVVMRVYDCSENYNECMVQVEVFNSINPVISCPLDANLQCGQDADPLLSGNIVTDPSLQGPADGLAFSNCDNLTIYYEDDASLKCGSGTILRTWHAADPAGTESTCTQIIRITDYDPFDPATDVVWPADVTITSCLIGADTSVTGAPTIFNAGDGCSDLMIDWEDDDLTTITGECLKILRRWRIVDWCYYVPNDPNPRGIWEHVQMIEVLNGDAPDLEGCDNTVFCNENPNCEPLDVDLSVIVSDDCTPFDQLTISWTVDLYSDGNPDFGPQYSGQGMNNSNAYPLGAHTICYNVTDGCRNTSSCCFEFRIVDCKKPTPVCKNGLSADIMASGMVAIKARFFAQGTSYDNCTDPNILRFSYSADVKDTTRVFTCAELGINVVDIWVTDEAGNQDFCTTFIDIQDNFGACTGPRSTIAGNVKDANGSGVSDVTVQLSGSSGLQMTTKDDGAFQFNGLPNGQDYSVIPVSNMKPNNGVSTYDIVLIKKHVLNIDKFDNPYQIIAADVNKSKNVSTLDIVQLRKLILRVEDHFPNNDSWRFVRKDYQFPNPSNPFESDFPEVLNVNNLSADELAADFVAIKVGDVNNTAKPNELLGVDDRTVHSDFIIHVDNKYYENGDPVSVEFKTGENESLAGCQFTLEFDKDALQLEDLIPGKLLRPQNFGLTLLHDGAITVSWDNSDLQTLANNQTLFTLKFRTDKNGLVSKWLSLSSRYTEAEAYTEQGEMMNVSLDFGAFDDQLAESDGFRLYQNKPNPFNNATLVGFNLPESSNASLTILDLSGKILKTYSGEFQEGYNEFRVSKSGISGAGVYYYRLDTPQHSATMKMILFD